MTDIQPNFRPIVEDTSKTPVEIRLADAILGGPGAVERQEARGQQQLVQSAQIPTDGTKRPAEIESFTKLGIELGPETPGDPMFRSAKLPAGWKKIASNHSMGSWIVDDKGRKRFDIFYKAAHYDRRADIRPHYRRYEFIIKIGESYYRFMDYTQTGGIPRRTIVLTKDQRQAHRFRGRADIAREFGPDGDYGVQFQVEIPADAKFLRLVKTDDPIYVELIGEPEKADGEEPYVPYQGE